MNSYLGDALLRALYELPDAQREAFLMKAEGGLSIEEISQITGVGRETDKSRLSQGRAIALFPFLAVPCRDDGARSFYAGRGKPVAGYYLLDPAAACRDWTHSVLPPVVPKRIDVPTLVLAGQLDPITPPAYGRRTAARLGPATTFVEVPSVGHGATSQSACAASIVDRFIEAPTRPVDSSCLTRTPPMDFK